MVLADIGHRALRFSTLLFWNYAEGDAKSAQKTVPFAWNTVGIFSGQETL